MGITICCPRLQQANGCSHILYPCGYAESLTAGTPRCGRTQKTSVALSRSKQDELKSAQWHTQLLRYIDLYLIAFLPFPMNCEKLITFRPSFVRRCSSFSQCSFSFILFTNSVNFCILSIIPYFIVCMIFMSLWCAWMDAYEEISSYIQEEGPATFLLIALFPIVVHNHTHRLYFELSSHILFPMTIDKRS